MVYFSFNCDYFCINLVNNVDCILVYGKFYVNSKEINIIVEIVI